MRRLLRRRGGTGIFDRRSGHDRGPRDDRRSGDQGIDVLHAIVDSSVVEASALIPA